MSGLSVSTITKANCDAGTDDPKLALLTDLATAIDTINAIIAAAQADSARLTTLSGIDATQAADLAALSTFIGTLLNDASAGVALTTLGAPLNAVAAKSAAYTVVAADRGKLIDYTTGTYTLSLDAAATLGAGFAFAVRNSGSGTITIDANASEQIDGATTVTVAAGESCLVVCNGTAWKTVGTVSLAKLHSANGYQTLPGGLIVQWGSYTATMVHGTTYSPTFPLTFPNNCFKVVAYVGETVATTTTTVTCPETAKSATGFSFEYGAVNGGSYSTTVHFVAIGN